MRAVSRARQPTVQYSAAAREARLANNRTYNSNKHSSSFSRNKIFRHEGFRHEGPKLYFVLREKEPVQILIFHFKQVRSCCYQRRRGAAEVRVHVRVRAVWHGSGHRCRRLEHPRPRGGSRAGGGGRSEACSWVKQRVNWVSR